MSMWANAKKDFKVAGALLSTVALAFTFSISCSVCRAWSSNSSCSPRMRRARLST